MRAGVHDASAVSPWRNPDGAKPSNPLAIPADLSDQTAAPCTEDEIMIDLDVAAIAELQTERTTRWHREDPGVLDTNGLLHLVEENHLRNFLLWHEEDEARIDDLGAEHVYRAKRAIDGLNQARNDFIERIDDLLYQAFGPFGEDCPMNSETPGMIIDRLSILALKEFHMREQAERPDAEDHHREACAGKLEVILRQRRDLADALGALVDQMSAGKRGFRVYRQFKMYNDPSLNPQLYRRRSG